MVGGGVAAFAASVVPMASFLCSCMLLLLSLYHLNGRSVHMGRRRFREARAERALICDEAHEGGRAVGREGRFAGLVFKV